MGVLAGCLATTLCVAAGLLAAESSAVGPDPELFGCPAFPDPPHSLSPHAPSLPNQAAWNQDISRAPVARNSARVIAYIDRHGGDHLHPDFGSPRSYGLPYGFVGFPKRWLPIHYTAYGEESDRGPFPIPPDARVEGGPASDGDRHVIVLDRTRCILYELYGAFFERRPRPHWNADSGARWNLRSRARRPDSWTSADAAGLPIFPGLVRHDEAAEGRVGHAIRVTFASTRNAWIHPATHCAGETTSPNAPAMGARLRLRRGYPLRGFTGPARRIAIALKRYGMIVADNGSNWFIGGSSDRAWDDENLNQLKRIPGRAFQVVRSRARPHVC